jgi:hypothetical protein
MMLIYLPLYDRNEYITKFSFTLYTLISFVFNAIYANSYNTSQHTTDKFFNCFFSLFKSKS